MIIELGIAAGVGVAAIIAGRKVTRRVLTALPAAREDADVTKRKSQPVIAAPVEAPAQATAVDVADADDNVFEETPTPVTAPIAAPAKAAAPAVKAPNPDGLDSLRATHPTE